MIPASTFFFYRERQNREHGPILGQKIENNYFEIENNAGPPNQIDPQMSWFWIFSFDNFTNYLNNDKV